MSRLAFLPVLALSGLAIAQAPPNPILTRNGRPYSLIFLRFEPHSGNLMEGASRWQFLFSAANTMTTLGALSHPYLKEDIEADRLTMRYSRGLRNGWTGTVEVPIEDLGGGFMDPLIEWYHRTFLRLTNDRTFTPYGGHTVLAPGEPTRGGGIGLADVSLFLRHDIGRRTDASVALKLPTGNPLELLGSGRPDAGFSVQTWFPLGRHFVGEADASVVFQSQAVGLSGTRSIALQHGILIEYRQNSRDAYVLQYGVESSGLNIGVPDSDQPHPSTSFAYERRLSGKTLLTAFFTENVDMFNPNLPVGTNIGPDFTVGIGLTIRD